MFAHHRSRLLTRGAARVGNGVNRGKDFIVATHGVIDRGNIDGDKPINPLCRQRGQGHDRLTAHGMTYKGGFLNPMFIQRIPQILRHRGISHLRGAGREAMIAHVYLEDVIIADQIAGEDAQIIEAAEQPVNEYDG